MASLLVGEWLVSRWVVVGGGVENRGGLESIGDVESTSLVGSDLLPNYLATKLLRSMGLWSDVPRLPRFSPTAHAARACCQYKAGFMAV
jgi:hypothetical protein